jgi:hypothetical protein
VARNSFCLIAATLMLAGGLMAPGCGKSETAATKPAATKPSHPLIEVVDTEWCKEHFMPESVCVQCHAELAEAYKKKGDWCQEHGLPDSQCFRHHPELKEKFIAEYRAQHGKEPPG